MSAQPKYNLTLRVTGAQKLATIIALLDQEAELVSMDQHWPEPRPVEPEHRYVDGKRNKGISARDLVFEVLKDRKFHLKSEIEEAFVSRGFAENSCSPTLSKLVKERAIVRKSACGDVIYALWENLDL